MWGRSATIIIKIGESTGHTNGVQPRGVDGAKCFIKVFEEIASSQKAPSSALHVFGDEWVLIDGQIYSFVGIPVKHQRPSHA